MRRPWFLLLLPLAACGCAGDTASGTGNQVAPERTVNVRTVIAPDVNTATELGLLHGRDKVKVSEEWEAVKKVFPDPRGSYEINDLPTGLSGPDYRVRGWESPNEGFGVILYKDRVALAKYTVERENEDRVGEILDSYRREYGTPSETVPPELLESEDTGKSRVRYWFWTRGAQRLMICAMRTIADGTNVTVAVGDQNTMDAIGMSVVAAKNDQAKAERALDQQSPK